MTELATFNGVELSNIGAINGVNIDIIGAINHVPVNVLELTAPENLSAEFTTKDNDEVLVSWDSVTGAITYELQRMVNLGGSWVTLQDSASTSYYDTDFDPNNVATLFYRVRSKASGAESEWSNEVFIVTG